MTTPHPTGPNRLKKPVMNDSVEQIKSTFTKAHETSGKIRDMPLSKRLQELGKIKTKILEQKEQILDQVCSETGKSRTDALTSEILGVLDAIDFLTKFAAQALKDEKVHTPLALMGKKSQIFYEPRGVIFVVAPWNYPFIQCLVPCLFSFVAGNATVFKPSEHTPLQGLVEKLLQDAGFFQNAIQIVYGDGQVGNLAIDQKPDYISFTGSVRTGKKIMARAAADLIPLELELGGKDPMVVFEDVDLKRTVAGALWGSFTNAGQSCTSVERIFVAHSIYDEFLERLTAGAKGLQTVSDDPLDIDMGGMTAKFQIELVHKQVEDARKKGAKIHCGGEWDGKALYYPPTVISGVTKEMDMFDSETFGPVVVAEAFATEGEAIEKANDSSFGLSASVWSRDLQRCDRVARKIKTGNVSINNVMLTEGNGALPFGGVKLSGIGRIKGFTGLRGCCSSKSVIVDKQSSKIEANWYPYTPKKYELFSGFMNLFRGGVGGLIAFATSGLKLESHSQKER